jgi:hypothetical protein
VSTRKVSEHENGSVSTVGGIDPGQIVDKAALLSGAAFGMVDFPVPGFGIIKIRPLSRAQAMAVYGHDLDAAEMEQVVVSSACVNPTFTPAEVEQWQVHSTAGGPLLKLVTKILEISGMEIGAGKAAYKRFRGPAGA